MITHIRNYKILFITLCQLGIMSIARVALYRFLLKIGHFKNSLKVKVFVETGPFFSGKAKSSFPKHDQSSQEAIAAAEALVGGSLSFFSHHDYRFKGIPNWFFDPFTQKEHRYDKHWAMLDEFSFEGSDVKILWEASRFSWAPTLAQAFLLTKDYKYLAMLNDWLRNWCSNNPANQGIQWKCGQEASLRLLHFLTAMKLLGELDNPTRSTIEFVRHHLARVAPTTFYAQAQRNNHLTSEAAALFIGGHWLEKVTKGKCGKKFYQKGRKLLEWAAASLIYDDGSFAQHSVVYHRVMLDTLSLCEIWRKDLALPAFSKGFTNKAQRATDWLFYFTDGKSGDAPNLGGNDGSHIINLGQDNYRDFRPTVQTASRHFYNKCVYPKGHWDAQLIWLSPTDLELTYAPKKKASKIFPQGGYYIHVSKEANHYWFLLRLPRYKDRPAHSDTLHFDLWSEGENILCDSGSYSYSAGDKSVIAGLKGVAGHNTIQFDDHDQMPVLGRFLFGNWLKGNWSVIKADGSPVIKAGYRDNWNNHHKREIFITEDGLKIRDVLEGRAQSYSLGWHVGQEPLKCALEILCNDDVVTSETVTSPISFKYLKMEKGNCVRVEGCLEDTMTIETNILFNV